MTLIIGHRGGAPGYAPENTISAAAKALKLGAEMIEFDVHLSKDREVVLIHDNSLGRTTNGKGAVNLKKLSQLKRLKTGKNDTIPSLKEFLDFINRRVPVNIEIKSIEATDQVAKIVREYVENKGWSYNDFLVSCFDHEELYRIRKNNPRIRLGALLVFWPRDLSRIKKRLRPYSVNADRDIITKNYLQKAHRLGLKVFTYVVNDRESMKRFTKLGVDGIFTDYPDRMKSIKGE